MVDFGTHVDVKISVIVPVKATVEQVKEWLKYKSGYTSEMSIDNPLCDCDMESCGIEFL